MNIYGALFALFVSICVLAGCQSPKEKLAEKVLEQQLGEDVQIDFDEEGGAVVEAGEGQISIGTKAKIPPDFPAEFPLPQGELTSAINYGESWELSFAISDEEQIGDLVQWFPDNEYTSLSSSDYGELKQWVFENDYYVVSIWLSINDDSKTFSYLIALKDEQ